MVFSGLKGFHTLKGDASARKTKMNKKYISMLNEKGIIDLENL